MAKQGIVAEKKGSYTPIEEKIELPSGVTAKIEMGVVTIKGAKGEVKKILRSPEVTIKEEGNSVIISTVRSTKGDKKMVYTFVAHLNNMIRGVQEGYTYKLKVCSSHFPIKTTVAGSEFIIKNFLGEREPRTMKITPGVKIIVNGSDIIVEGIDKEATSQVAATIERISMIKGRDRRVFQDGIFITEKAGKSIME
jgi:large subunit ribosomal protein L6